MEATNTTRSEFLSGLTDLPLVREVACKDCGACCQHMGYPPFMVKLYDRNKPEPWENFEEDYEWFMAAPASERKLMIDGLYGMRGDEELPCVWLDQETKRCRNYDHRPGICRDFEMGSPECLEHREQQGIT